MDERGGYGQFCPVSMASEILCSRWTTLVVRELLCGSTRFNDLRRGVPRMSPALLSKRLKELEQRRRDHRVAQVERLRRVSPIGSRRGAEAVDHGARQSGRSAGWSSRLSLKNLDPSLLMWDMRRSLNVKLLPDRTMHDTVSVLGAGGNAEELVAGGGRGDGRPLQFRSWLRAGSAGEKLACDQ